MNCLYCHAPFIQAFSWWSLFVKQEMDVLCDVCSKKLEPICEPKCDACSRPLSTLQPELFVENRCLDCIYWEKHPRWKDTLTKNISLYVYNDFLKEVFTQFKFRGDYALARIFGRKLRLVLSSISFDVLVPIPLSEERLLERGFNQVTALADAAQQEVKDVLKRNHSEKQSKKTREERLSQNLLFSFMGDEREICGKNILLLDDIYTTGTTLHHAAKVLRAVGAKKVVSVTIAR